MHLYAMREAVRIAHSCAQLIPHAFPSIGWCCVLPELDLAWDLAIALLEARPCPSGFFVSSRSDYN